MLISQYRGANFCQGINKVMIIGNQIRELYLVLIGATKKDILSDRGRR